MLLCQDIGYGITRNATNTDGRCTYFNAHHPWLHCGNLQRKKDPYKYGNNNVNYNNIIGA